jgi:hypothetical protein
MADNHPVVVAVDPRCTPDTVGYIPTFLHLDDPRPAKEQFAERYVYGGWRHQDGFTKGRRRYELQYPGDPPLSPLAIMMIGEEIVTVYAHSYVAIWQKDGSFEACRMD